MKTNISGLLVVMVLFAYCVSAFAQHQSGNIPRIGFLQRRAAPTPSNPDPLADAFLQGLRDLGYIDGKNIRIEHRYAGGRSERLPKLVEEFLQLNVDVIIVASGPAIRVVKQATTTTPIVIITQEDPVAAKFVENLARPGGNITGLTRLTSELSGKRLELLKETFVGIMRVGLLTGSGEPQTNADYEAAARAFNVTILPINISDPKPDLESAFQAAVRGGAKAMIVNRDAVTASYPKQVAEQAIKHRLPSMNEDRAYVEAGGLMSYGTNDAAQFQRAAYYVDRILKGAKPADLPVEQPTKFELVINLKTAKQIGLTIPQSLLYRADKVIR